MVCLNFIFNMQKYMDADLEQQEEDGKITKNKDIIINLPRIVAFNCSL